MKKTIFTCLLLWIPFIVGCSGSSEAQKPDVMGAKPGGLSSSEKGSTGKAKSKDDGLAGSNNITPVE